MTATSVAPIPSQVPSFDLVKWGAFGIQEGRGMSFFG